MIRGAEYRDAESIAKIHVRSWQKAYKGIVPDSYLDSLSIESRKQKWQKILSESPERTFVIENRPEIKSRGKNEAASCAEVAGWASVDRSRDDDRTDSAELYAIYIDPDMWGKGFGKLLIMEAEARAVSNGFRDIFLWVLEDNMRARGFYENCGYTVDKGKKKIILDNSELTEVRYRKALSAQKVL
jgi:ribosomal protein S18 acetylase RimI-like enzyme